MGSGFIGVIMGVVLAPVLPTHHPPYQYPHRPVGNGYTLTCRGTPPSTMTCTTCGRGGDNHRRTWTRRTCGVELDITVLIGRGSDAAGGGGCGVSGY